jgi:hypothetical protein
LITARRLSPAFPRRSGHGCRRSSASNNQRRVPARSTGNWSTSSNRRRCPMISA